MEPATQQEMDEYVAALFDSDREEPDETPAPPIALVQPKKAEHGPELRDITKLPEVMDWVANGQTWNARKLEKFFQYCAAEAVQPDAERENYYHVVEESGRCVGIVGIHPIAYDRQARGKAFLTIFLSPQVCGRGAGAKAIADALADYWSRHPEATVYADVRTDNFPMLRVAEKLAFERGGILHIGKKHYFRFAAARR